MTKHYGASDFNMQYKKIYLGDKYTGFSVVPSDETSTLQKMWKVKYPDETLSKDHYNLTWAKEHAVTECARILRTGETCTAGPPVSLN